MTENDDTLQQILSIAEQLLNSGNIVKAEEYFNEGLHLAEMKGNIGLQAMSLCGLGRILCEKRLYEQALLNFNKSISLANELPIISLPEIGVPFGGLNIISKVYNEIAVLYRVTGANDKAIEILIKLIDIDKQVGTDDDLACDYGNLGNNYLEKSNLKSALQAYNEAYSYSKKAGNQEFSSNLSSKIDKLMAFFYDNPDLSGAHSG